jgi:glycosyltransferase involved in cell wall biosynthesis
MLTAPKNPQYAQAISYFESGELRQAKELLEKIIKELPLSADAQNDLGAIYFLEGSPAEALGPVSIALALDPENLSYRQNFEAITEKLKGIENRFNQPSPKIRVGVFYDEEGWAWWIRSHAIKNALPSDIDLTIMHLHTLVDHNDFDFLLLYDHNLITEVRGKTPIPLEKIILANSCPLYIQDADAALKKFNFPAAIVNNLTAFNLVKSDPRWHCCENGVDTSLFNLGSKSPTKFTAGWVGHSQSIGQKGLDIIREACKIAEVELLIVDAKDKPKESRANSQEWLRDNLYHNVSVYMCASLNEGTPNPALEALSCGLPVITTRVGNMPELIKDGVNGYIVERNARSMADALIALRGKDLRQAARASVAPNWDWKVKAQNYATIFRMLKRQSLSI